MLQSQFDDRWAQSVLESEDESETLTSPLDKRQKPRPARRWENHPEIRLVKSWVAFFTEKKRLRQDFPAAQGLSNPGWPFSVKKKRLRQDFPAAQQHRACQLLGGHFHRKKAPAARLPSGNRACQILGGHFHQKKAPAAGLPSSNRACQVWAKVRSAPKTSNLARTGSRSNSLG